MDALLQMLYDFNPSFLPLFSYYITLSKSGLIQLHLCKSL